MRTGACTVQQALTTEAASVLKHSLNLAKRRGHAQVTPLHVAATLLSSTRETTSLFRRACLKSHPHHPNSHPLQCRALELCFNVALNRLPTTPPPSSGPLLHTHPSLSNALIAALKRAQAHQRRGCIEQQQQQQQPPLLAVKVELEQLIVSILDDPSVSRVMREAGFSSTCVKNNLEEDSSSSAASSSIFFDTQREIINLSSFWQTHFLKPHFEQNPLPFPSQKEDLRLVIEVFQGKNKRNNTVVVGDSVSYTGRLVTELMDMVERREVPEELRSSQFIKFQLSSVELKLMSRSDVDSKLSELRRKVGALTSERGAVIIYVGDLRWVVDEDMRDVAALEGGFRAGDHFIGEVGRLLSDMRSCNNGGVTNKVCLMATASYQTYMKCQMKRPTLETQWGLQAVAVPSGGLALSLHAPRGLDSRVTMLSPNHFQRYDTKPLKPIVEQDKLCSECTSNFHKEVSNFKSDHGMSSPFWASSTETKDNNSSSTQLPHWLQPQKPVEVNEDIMMKLRRKWNRLCQRHHGNRFNQFHLCPPLFNQTLVNGNHARGSSHPWWSPSILYDGNRVFPESNSISFAEFTSKPNGGRSNFKAQLQNENANLQEKGAPGTWLSEVGMDSLQKNYDPVVRTTLALGNALFSDSAIAMDQRGGVAIDPLEFRRQLYDSIPWQCKKIDLIVDALQDRKSCVGKGTWLLIEGSDRIGKRRLLQAIQESSLGSMNRLVRINMRKFKNKASHCAQFLVDVLTKDPCCVLSIEEIDSTDAEFLEYLARGVKHGKFEDPNGRMAGSAQATIIVTTSNCTKFDGDASIDPDAVIKMKLHVEEVSTNVVVSRDLKRKLMQDLPKKSKGPRRGENNLDLNICAKDYEEEEEDNIPSDLTQEADGGDQCILHRFVESVGTRFVLDTCPDQSHQMSEYFMSRISRSFDKVVGRSGRLSIDGVVVEELIAASDSFLNSLFEKWLREVYEAILQTVKQGGKVRLSVEGRDANSMESGFNGSNLPSRILVG